MIKKIKDIANIRSGVYLKSVIPGEVIHLQTNHIDDRGNIEAGIIPDLPISAKIEKHLLKSGDVIFVAKGIHNLATVFYDFDKKVVASTSFLVFYNIDSSVTPEFLAFYLNHPKTQAIINTKSRGTNLPSIRISEMEKLEIEVPTIEKQQLILRINELAKMEEELTIKLAALKRIKINHWLINELKNNL